MPIHLYANLAPLGWTELDSNSIISNHRDEIITWVKEGGLLDSISSPIVPNKLDDFPFVHIHHEGRDYRVSPFHLQVVNY